MALIKTTRINFLFDFYQSLLTDKQRMYMNLYYLEDLSLGEIAGEFGVSRQAVYDNVRRTEAMLEDYEVKLNLFDKFQERKKIVESMQQLITGMDDQSETLRNLLVTLKDYD
ncbi:putative DNA-binding protein [Sporosarcina sp. G11-34]|uniref:putative DNA-binding protein n=1 Tax=Sporosarcina sp. G11-34 TaxID=2849605 RepID=UPI0022A90FC9|nr:putative DNA-binding protein [Sporosarcina sp. G11-34]MCZ2258814.1 putative DNA-binding protein [Sporosarcina sp. G11-34]